MANTKAKLRGTVTHTVPIPVVENLEHALYFRTEMGSGKTGDGRPIEISLNMDGGHLIVMVGDFQKPNGQQFVVSITNLVEALVNHTVLSPAKEGDAPAA